MFKNEEKSLKINNKIILITALIITIISIIPIFKSGIFAGHDILFQISRLDGIITSIQDHQFPLALYPNKNYGFGYPSPQFYSDIFLIIPAIIRFILNIPYVTMYKIIIFGTVFFTNFSIIYCTYKLFNKFIPSVLVSFLFSFSNYFQTDIFVRSALGELIAFAIIPWIIYNIYIYVYKDKNNYIILGVCFAAILYAHNISFLLCVIYFGILIILNINKLFKNKNKIYGLFGAIGVGFLLSFAFLIPMLYQYNAQTLMVHKIDNNMLHTNAVNIGSLLNDFITQFSFSYNNQEGFLNIDLTKSLGIILTLLPILLFILKKNKSKPLYDMFIAFIIFLICSTNLIPLYKIELISFLQFPSRLYLIASMVACFIIAMAYNNKIINKYVISCIVLFSIWNVSFLHINLMTNENLNIIKENSTYEEMYVDCIYAIDNPSNWPMNFSEIENAEYLPFGWNFNYQKASKCILFENGNETICNHERYGSHFDFYTNYQEDYRIMLPATWYLGYRAQEIDDDGNVIKDVHLWKNESSNRITMTAEKGYHHYRVWYSGTKVQKASTIISLATSVSLILFMINNRRKVNQ